jgi:hypothetical protein
MKTLGGSMFIRNGELYDYNYKESIQCLQEFCDSVCIVYIEGDDKTLDGIFSVAKSKTKIITLTKEDWDIQKGKEKLSFFSNIAISALNTDYNFSLQADEILHEDSYQWVRVAIEKGDESFLCSRINLWKSPYLQLNVPHERKPCSTNIVRLAKIKYRHYDDAESIDAFFNDEFCENIKIIHYGFVRKREVMKDKIKNMQQGVFEMADYDSKLDLCDTFNPDLWFNKKDLVPIEFSTPDLMQKWASERVY